jgi:uncharacterized cupin superfamily protein
MDMEEPRSECIVHYSSIQEEDTRHYPGNEELLSIGAKFAKHFGFKKLGIHHETLLPGRRTSFPHAESSEEEFIFVIDGTPDAWIDGRLHRLQPGDGVGFSPGTGIAHCFLNNTTSPVRLLVVGEANKAENKIVYPLNPELRQYRMNSWWNDAPPRKLGPHDGRPTEPPTRTGG